MDSYCTICGLRVAPYDPDRFKLNGEIFHRKCVKEELSKPQTKPTDKQLLLFGGTNVLERTKVPAKTGEAPTH
jgi:hypothetical protein